MKPNRGYLNDIGQLYSAMLSKVIVEKANPKFGDKSFPKATGKVVSSKKAKKGKPPFVGKKSGPAAADGFDAKLTSDPKFSQASEKTETRTINTDMSKRFDSLYADVIKNKLQLETPDVDSTDDILASPEAGEDTAGGEVTDGLSTDFDETDETADMSPSELVAKALDYLSKAQEKLDGDENAGVTDDLSGDAGDLPAEPGAGDSAPVGDVSGEATEIAELKDANGAKLQNKNNKVPSEQTRLAKGGKADSKVTDKTGNQETGAHPLVGDALGAVSKMTNIKNNKVDASKTKTGHYVGQA